MDKEEELFKLILDENFSEAKKVLNASSLELNKLLRDGIAILHVLAGQEREEASELLEIALQSGGDPNLPSVDSLTPVHVAAMWGRRNNLQLLLNYGGCADLQDDEGLTALDHSSNSQEPDSPDCRKILNVFIDNSWLTETSGCEEHCFSDYLTADETLDKEINKTNFLKDLNDSEVSFPHLHPWLHQSESNVNLDDTVVDNFRQLEITDSDSCVKSEALNSPYPVICISSDETISGTLSADNGHECDSNENSQNENTVIYDWKDVSTVECSSTSEDGESICIPEKYKTLNPRELRKKLESLGEVPGPITSSTHRVYLKYLARIVSGKCCDKRKKSPYNDYISELRNELEGKTVSGDMYKDEEQLCRGFDKPGRTWREGCEKASFNYILLDPRATNNLPARAKKMCELDVFRSFIAAVFYIGKGKRSRPYAHLYEALDHKKKNKKVEQIRDIWQANLGVISLHCFQNVIPVEAYTREACMVETFGLSRLTNVKRGDYYGEAKYWTFKKKRLFGLFLLKRAMRIFLNEGERCIRPQDLKHAT